MKTSLPLGFYECLNRLSARRVILSPAKYTDTKTMRFPSQSPFGSPGDSENKAASNNSNKQAIVSIAFRLAG